MLPVGADVMAAARRAHQCGNAYAPRSSVHPACTARSLGSHRDGAQLTVVCIKNDHRCTIDQRRVATRSNCIGVDAKNHLSHFCLT